MSLNLAPTEQRSPLKYVVVAAIIMAAVVVVLYFTTWRKMAELSVPKSDVFAPQTTMKATAGTMHVVGTVQSVENNVYIVAHVRFTDKMSIPMAFNGATAVMTLPSNEVVDAEVIGAHDVDRLETLFPDLKPMVHSPIYFGDDFPAKTTKDVDIVLLFPGMTQDIWAKRKSATLTLNFAHQEPMTATIP